MTTLLVIAQHPALPEAIMHAVAPEEYRVLHRINLDEAEPLLHPGLIDACIFEAETDITRGIWAIEKARRMLPHHPFLVYAASLPWEWEEEAYLQGVNHVLAKPVKPRLLTSLLGRFWTAAAPPG